MAHKSRMQKLSRMSMLLFSLQWKWMVNFLLVMTLILVCSSVILIFTYYYSAYYYFELAFTLIFSVFILILVYVSVILLSTFAILFGIYTSL